MWTSRRRERSMAALLARLAVLTLVAFPALRCGGESATREVAEAGSTAATSYPRGPNNGRLLSDTSLQVEVTIYETGVEPQFRVYPFDASMKPVNPSTVTLRIELHRLGGRVDTITFEPEEAYLLGTQVVEEPHSFDVKVFAEAGGKAHSWSYSQIEGKVRLTDAQLVSAGVSIDTVRGRVMTSSLELPGQIVADETRLAHVVARLGGVVLEVRKQEGDRVERGELLAVVNSRELADAKSAYLGAAHHVEFTARALEREETLWKRRISAERDYLDARRQADEAERAKRLAEQTLIGLGLNASEVAHLASASAESMARYEIRAPLSGRVVERNVTVGEAVTGDEDIFTVADLSTVWVDIAVPAKDLALVTQGQAATVRSSDVGAESEGRVRYVAPLVGQETRSATARVVLPNGNGRWRPGLFVTVQLVRERVSVPMVVAAAAIQTFRDWQVVFVRYGDEFEARPLELGRSDGQWVEVLSGLTPGVRYASRNSFAVKAEIGKLGATHDH